MSKFKTYLLLVAWLLMSSITACSDDDAPAGEIEFIVTETALSFSSTSGTNSFSVQSGAMPTVTSNKEWCKVVRRLGESTKVFTYDVTLEKNETTDVRDAEITIATTALTQTIAVTQFGSDKLLVKKTAYDVAAAGETITVELQTTGNYTIVINNPWIAQPTVARALTDEAEQFVIAANSGAERTGTISFTLAGVTETVTVKQALFVAPEGDKTGMDSDAKTLAAKMKIGWNLGNTLETIGGETAWGNPKATKALIDAVKAAGFNAVRIPCAWDGYLADANFTIKANWMLRVKEVVDYCVNNNMYAILNIHWDGGWLQDNCTPGKQEEVNKKQKALWTQIANAFNSYDERLLFAGCNEPNVDKESGDEKAKEEMAVLRSYEQTFIDAVRATGGKNAYRNLIVQGPNTDIECTEKYFGNMPTDNVPNRLMAEIHYYTPWNFCGMEIDETWGKMVYFWGDGYHVDGSDRNATWGEEEEMKQLFQKMKTQFVDKGIPVILGEYGAIRRDDLTGAAKEAHLKSRIYFTQYATEQAKNYGLIPYYWDNGYGGNNPGNFALFNRINNTVYDAQLLEAIMKGAEAGKYPY